MTTSPRWRIALAAAGSAAVLVAAPLVGVSTAHADPYAPTPCPTYPPRPPHLTLNRTEVQAGGRLEFRATCFGPYERVRAELHSNEVFLGTFTANAQGTVKGKVTIPKRTKPGFHIFELEGSDPDLQASARIKVTREEGGRHDGDHNGDHNGDHDGDHSGDHKGHGGQGDSSSHHGSSASGSDQRRPSLASTGGEKALVLGGTTAGLLAAGVGAMMAVRRRRSS